MKSLKLIKKIKNLKENFFLILLSFITLIVIVNWFSSLQQIAGGEESFSIFNDRNIITLNGYWEDIGTGFANPTNLGRIVPSLFIVSLRFLHFPFWFGQAMIFYFLMVTGLYSMFFLTKVLVSQVKKDSHFIYFISSIFYFFNIYSMTQIWGRFLYAHIYVWAFLPLFLLLWIQWITKSTKKILLLFLSVSFIYSLAYMQPAFILTLWTPALFWSFFAVGKKIREKESYAGVIFSSIVGIIGWLITNIWWIYPYVVLSKTAFLAKMNIQSNIDSLRGVSQYFSSDQIFTLRQSFLLGNASPWFSFYSQWWVISLSIFILILVILGIIKSKRNTNWFFLSTLLFLGWFVSKGTNPPLGDQIYSLLFSQISFSAVLRNSYEKFGIVFLLPYVIFFALGVTWLRERFITKKIYIFDLLVFFFIFIVLVWPLWTGDIYRNSKVDIPGSYKKMNKVINSNTTDSRLLVFPLLPGDGIRYTWGYTGVEPSEYFFDKFSISKILRQSYFDEVYMQTYNTYTSGNNLDSKLDELNVQYLLLHNDINTKSSGSSTSAEVENYFKKDPNIKKIIAIDNLSLYKYKSSENQKIFVATGKNIPNIFYKRITNDRYTINITHATKPYVLVFKETFHPLWEAKINDRKLEKHIIVNTYANGWKIEKTGNYQINVAFRVWPWQ